MARRFRTGCIPPPQLVTTGALVSEFAPKRLRTAEVPFCLNSELTLILAPN
jgi:hypothetical protein